MFSGIDATGFNMILAASNPFLGSCPTMVCMLHFKPMFSVIFDFDSLASVTYNSIGTILNQVSYCSLVKKGVLNFSKTANTCGLKSQVSSIALSIFFAIFDLKILSVGLIM